MTSMFMFCRCFPPLEFGSSIVEILVPPPILKGNIKLPISNLSIKQIQHIAESYISCYIKRKRLHKIFPQGGIYV